MACALAVVCGLSSATTLRAAEPQPDGTAASNQPLRVIVMDPLSLPLSCACVPGVGQKDYGVLADSLKNLLGRPVEVHYAESLAAAYRRSGREIELIIGQRSVVLRDAAATHTSLRELLSLTDRLGDRTVRGVVIVRQDDPAVSLEDLSGRTIALGPVEMADCHAAVKEMLQAAQLDEVVKTSTGETVDEGVFALGDHEADAAVVPEYLPELLVGCQKVLPNSIRAIAITEPVPFVQVFATTRLVEADAAAVSQAMREISLQPGVLLALESKLGFVDIDAQHATAVNDSTAGWTDWRGPHRDGKSPDVPRELPPQRKPLWQVELTGPAMAGISATDRHVVVADKDAELTTDLFRCFDAATGEELWAFEYPSADDIDYTNAPRATPVIRNGLVYVQGASGNLHCLKLTTGEVVWERHLAVDFGAEAPTWGYSAPPLLVDGKLVVMPGSRAAGIAALNPQTGELLWRTPGHAAAYAPLIVGTFGSRRQIVGYDVAGLAGWDIETGARLWQLVPPGQTDFNVGTPVAVEGGILVATENNATRLYRFHADGTIIPLPAAVNEELAPDTCTPVIVGKHVYCTAYGELYCLDLADGLRTQWSRQDDRFFDHTNLIAGNGRLLMWTTTCDLLLLDATAGEYHELARRRPFADENANSMSHPAIVGERLYLRDGRTMACFPLPAKVTAPLP